MEFGAVEFGGGLDGLSTLGVTTFAPGAAEPDRDWEIGGRFGALSGFEREGMAFLD